MPDQSHPESSPPPPGGQPLPPAAAPTKATWRPFFFRWLKRLVIAAVVLVAGGATLLATAEHETSQPQFCGSCHVMTPYYKSWHNDMHGGKLSVACVDCHYAPGKRTTIKAKLRGLSQVASYISGSYGATRPRAHVDNQSCLTSKCHGDLKFMDKEISVSSTVKFFHAKHLSSQSEKQKAQARLGGFDPIAPQTHRQGPNGETGGACQRVHTGDGAD